MLQYAIPMIAFLGSLAIFIYFFFEQIKDFLGISSYTSRANFGTYDIQNVSWGISENG